MLMVEGKIYRGRYDIIPKALFMVQILIGLLFPSLVLDFVCIDKTISQNYLPEAPDDEW